MSPNRRNRSPSLLGSRPGNIEKFGRHFSDKRHGREFENTNCSLLDVIRVDMNQVIGPHEANVGEDDAARKAMGIVLYV
jgi:hypothetical protein